MERKKRKPNAGSLSLIPTPSPSMSGRQGERIPAADAVRYEARDDPRMGVFKVFLNTLGKEYGFALVGTEGRIEAILDCDIFLAIDICKKFLICLEEEKKRIVS
jgi:hypothetical protein